jgi:hypothetical protein
MAYSRDPRHYPDELRAAVVAAAERDEDIRFACGSPSRAATVRAQFYAYFRALRHADDPFYAATTQITIVREGNEVIVRLKSNTEEMRALRATIETEEKV